MSGLHLLAFLPAALLMALTPGPSNLLAFANGAGAGFGAAARGAGGRIAAYAILIAAVALGLGAALESSATALVVAKWVGVAYLLWLAWRLWRAPNGEAAEPGAEVSVSSRPKGLARREFMTGIVNPKAMVLFTAFLPQFVTDRDRAAAQLLILGAAYLVMEFLAASAWAGAGAALGAGGMSLRRRLWVDRGSAALLVAAAALLAREGRAA